MSGIPEDIEGLGPWLELGDKLIATSQWRCNILETRRSNRKPRDMRVEREAEQQVAELTQEMVELCRRMEALEEGFGVPHLLKGEVLSVPLRCVVALLARERLSNSGTLNQLGNLVQLAAGASQEAALAVRDAFMRDGCLRWAVKMEDSFDSGVLDEMTVSLKEGPFQALLGREPTIGEELGPYIGVRRARSGASRF
jgi:hypothetical protein